MRSGRSTVTMDGLSVAFMVCRAFGFGVTFDQEAEEAHHTLVGDIKNTRVDAPLFTSSLFIFLTVKYAAVRRFQGESIGFLE